MNERQNALHTWLKTTTGKSDFSLQALTGDASFRRYFRLHHEKKTQIVMDAPPEKENTDAFIHVAQLLKKGGIHIPHIHASDPVQGFLLLEDFGDTLFLHALTIENADNFYTHALQTLVRMQSCASAALPVFNETFMYKEMMLFREWFLEAYLELSLSPDDNNLLETTFHWITEQIAEQPRVFIHRDYHSRNLMIQSDTLGIIDFQDAMHGPFTYDIVSLLKDAYIAWPKTRIEQWLRTIYPNIASLYDYSFDTFYQAFTLCGIQRHLKILGVFCRLYLRDNKSGYLRDLPLTFRYLKEGIATCPKLQSFTHWLEKKVEPAFIETGTHA